MFLLLWACNRPPPMHPMIVPTDIQVDFYPGFLELRDGITVREAGGVAAGTLLQISDLSIPMLSGGSRQPPDPPPPEPGQRSPTVSTSAGPLPAESVAAWAVAGWLRGPLSVDLDGDGATDQLSAAEHDYPIWSENQEMWLGRERAGWLIVSNAAGRGLIRVEGRDEHGGGEEPEWIRAVDLAGDGRLELAVLVRTTVPEAGYGGRELRLYTQAKPGGGPLRELAAIHVGDPPGAGLTGPRLGWLVIHGGDVVRHDLWREPGDAGMWHRLTRYRREDGGLTEAPGAAERLDPAAAGRLRFAFDAAVERGGYDDPWCRWVRSAPDRASAEQVELEAGGGCGG